MPSLNVVVTPKPCSVYVGYDIDIASEMIMNIL